MSNYPFNQLPQFKDMGDGRFTENTYITGSDVKDVTLQDGAAAIGNGTEFIINGYKTLTIKVYGTSTSRTVVFEQKGVDGAYEPIQGLRLSDMTMATQTTGTGETWTFDVTGVPAFRVRISAISGGTVTVKGKVVA